MDDIDRTITDSDHAAETTPGAPAPGEASGAAPGPHLAGDGAAEHPADQRVGSLPALRRVFYACHRGRGTVFCFPHKLQKASHGRPCYTPTIVTHRHDSPRPTRHGRSIDQPLTVKPQL